VPDPVVRAARRDEAPALAATLASAFGGTATFQWLIADDAARERLLPAFFESSLQHLLASPGAVLVAEAGGSPVAVAAWAPPGRWKAPWWRGLLSMPRLVRAADGATLREFGSKGPALERALEAAHPSEPHWYLSALGTAPAAQGTGAAGALVEAGLRRSREQGLPAYLECVPELIGYYERFGFRVAHEIVIGGGAPDQVGMLAD
jgi:ribosomal protein S18 acetylase RimI-like enzyme